MIAAIPRAGKSVEIQYRVGNGWSKFRITTKAYADGRFVIGYPFKAGNKPVLFEFRARAILEPDWPFVTGTSRSVKVLVKRSR